MKRPASPTVWVVGGTSKAAGHAPPLLVALPPRVACAGRTVVGATAAEVSRAHQRQPLHPRLRGLHDSQLCEPQCPP